MSFARRWLFVYWELQQRFQNHSGTNRSMKVEVLWRFLQECSWVLAFSYIIDKNSLQNTFNSIFPHLRIPFVSADTCLSLFLRSLASRWFPISEQTSWKFMQTLQFLFVLYFARFWLWLGLMELTQNCFSFFSFHYIIGNYLHWKVQQKKKLFMNILWKSKREM